MIIFCLIDYIYFDLMYSNYTMHATKSKFKLNHNFHYTASVTHIPSLALSKIT